MTDKTQPTAAPAGQIDPKTQKELMRQAGIWVESSTLYEDDLPARELKAVQAEQHHLDLYTQLVAQRAALQAAPPAPAGVAVPEDWMEHLGFELDAPADGVWLVIDDTGARREAGLVERVLWKELIAIRAALAAAPAQPVAVPADALDSVRVLLRVAKNQISKASMQHAIGVVQAQLEKAAACIYAAAPAQEHATQLAGQGREAQAAQWRNITKVVRALADFCFGSKDDPQWGIAHIAIVNSLTAKDGLDVSALGLEPLPGAPAQAQEVARDAARWRFLREEHEGEAESLCVFGPNDMRECLVPIGSLPGELDAFIDAARAAQGNA